MTVIVLLHGLQIVVASVTSPVKLNWSYYWCRYIYYSSDKIIFIFPRYIAYQFPIVSYLCKGKLFKQKSNITWLQLLQKQHSIELGRYAWRKLINVIVIELPCKKMLTKIIIWQIAALFILSIVYRTFPNARRYYTQKHL